MLGQKFAYSSASIAAVSYDQFGSGKMAEDEAAPNQYDFKSIGLWRLRSSISKVMLCETHTELLDDTVLTGVSVGLAGRRQLENIKNKSIESQRLLEVSTMMSVEELQRMAWKYAKSDYNIISYT